MSGRIGAVAANFGRGEKPIRPRQMVDLGQSACQHWTSWMEGKSYCYTLPARGNSVSWVRNDGRSGSARIG